MDGDGALDLLVGDMVTVKNPAKGLDEKTARERHATWTKRLSKLDQRSDVGSEEMPKLFKEESKVIESKMTGFVWLLRQVPPASPGRNQR